MKDTNCLCHNINISNSSKICDNFELLINGSVNNLKIRHEELISLKQSQQNILQSRNKRGLIDLGGKIQNWAFGTLDQDDLIEINKHINENKIKNEKTLVILNKQTHVIKSTLGRVNSVINEFSENAQKLKTTFNTLNEQINNWKNTLTKIDYAQTLSEYIIYFNTLITELTVETQELIDAIFWAQKNVIRPKILTYKEISENLIHIQGSLNKQLVLPIDPTVTSEISQLFNIIEINTVFVGSYILFTLNIPICYNDIFMLYKIHSIPTHINTNQYIFIQSSYEYITISKDTEHYTTASSVQINNCKETNNFRLCNTINPINFKNHETYVNTPNL